MTQNRAWKLHPNTSQSSTAQARRLADTDPLEALMASAETDETSAEWIADRYRSDNSNVTFDPAP
jgi:hypothetical protein